MAKQGGCIWRKMHFGTETDQKKDKLIICWLGNGGQEKEKDTSATGRKGEDTRTRKGKGGVGLGAVSEN